MFNAFRRQNILTGLKVYASQLREQLDKLKELEVADIPLEKKATQIEEIRSSIESIASQNDNLKTESKFDTDFKRNLKIIRIYLLYLLKFMENSKNFTQ